MALNTFSQDFSSSAFIKNDDERRIVGKLCEIFCFDSGIFDIWIVRADREPIGTRKLNNLEKAISALHPCVMRTYWRLDGEAVLQTSDRDLVREVAFLCGVRRRKHYSDATLQCKRHQLAEIRARRRATVRRCWLSLTTVKR